MTSEEQASVDSEGSQRDFYRLGAEEQARRYTLLARKALGAWGLGDASLSPIKLRENAVFAVERADGSRSVLRVHRAGYHSDQALQSELQWMQALDEFGVHTPAAIVSASGAAFERVAVPEVPEPRQVDLMTWVSGQAIGSIEQGVGDVAAAVRNYQLVGRLVARMHGFARQWQPPPGFTRHAWDEEGLLGDQPLWGRFWELAALDADQRRKLQAAREKARTELAAYGKGVDRYGLIHADPLPENFLVEADGTVRVIDFDDGGYGWLLFDFATAMFVHLAEDRFDTLLQALVAGYREERELPPEFDARLPLFLLLRGFTYLGWAHTRSETETARLIAPLLVGGVMSLVEDYLQGATED